MQEAYLYLANGKVFKGLSPAWQQDSYLGEVVFNTGMTGYEETLTDPSYAGQILTFTYPILGNYGVSNGARFESNKIHVHGIICETIFNASYHHSSTKRFLTWLQENNTPLLMGVDSRELTKTIREYGALGGVISNNPNLKPNFKEMMAINWVAQVSPQEVTTIGNGKYKIVLVDFGAKENIIRELLKFDLTIKRVPYNYDYTQEEFDGVMLSNGPGDPKLCVESINILSRALEIGKPIFGICLGSQLLAHAVNATTYKLKYGHRGHNQPCIDLTQDLCFLTAQNHSYAVDEQSLPSDFEVTFRHLNDNTVSGLRHKTKPFFAVQFHPEASSGPQDTSFLFKQFFDLIKAAN